MTYQNNTRGGQGGYNRPPQSAPESLPLDKIKLSAPDGALFDTTANACAFAVSENGKRDKDKNKATQLRRFYDEVCLWEEKVRVNESRFNEFLPFIKMLNAKVAYAKGRNLVDSSFADLMETCLKQVTSPATFYAFKTFFEAFMGFYKMHKPK